MDHTKETGSEWWLSYFLLRTFFAACRAHNARRNQQNQYCISCEMAACKHCLAEGTHFNHKVIKVYKLVYNDVVSLKEMNQHLDCSRIQTYMSNGKLVLAISPLPHLGSGASKPDSACRHCARRLMNPDLYRFCSIACKFHINTGKSTIKPKPGQPPSNKAPDRDDNAYKINTRKSRVKPKRGQLPSDKGPDRDGNACKFRINTRKSIVKPKPGRLPANKGPDRVGDASPNKGPDRDGDAGPATNTDTIANTRVSVFRPKSLTGTGRRKGIPVRAPCK